MDLSKIVSSSPELIKTFPYETEFVKGLELDIAYISPDELDRVRERHRVVGRGRDAFHYKEYVAALTDKALRGWSGLTIRNLKGLVALEAEALKKSDNEEVSYSPDNARTLVRNAYGLWLFIFESATEIGHFQPVSLEDEKKT